jgi:hypothetical protein
LHGLKQEWNYILDAKSKNKIEPDSKTFQNASTVAKWMICCWTSFGKEDQMIPKSNQLAESKILFDSNTFNRNDRDQIILMLG